MKLGYAIHHNLSCFAAITISIQLINAIFVDCSFAVSDKRLLLPFHYQFKVNNNFKSNLYQDKIEQQHQEPQQDYYEDDFEVSNYQETTTTTRAPKRARSRRLSDKSSRDVSKQQQQNKSNKCALVLQRNYQTNNQQQQQSERICITYADVEQAISEAKRERSFNAASLPIDELESLEPSVELLSEVGELLQATTLQVSTRFALTNEEIANGLPLIDMSQTSIWPACPLVAKSSIECDPSARYRAFTGHCNSLISPTAGAALTPFARFLPAAHQDGVQSVRTSSLLGAELPNARLVVRQIHADADMPSEELSLMLMVFGQLIDHDIALAAPPHDSRGADFSCCPAATSGFGAMAKSNEANIQVDHPNCMPLTIVDSETDLSSPMPDPIYSKRNVTCMDFKRSLAGVRQDCALGTRVHINKVTASIDANTVYGSSRSTADSLRSYQGGQLRTQDLFFVPNRLKPLLPAQLDKPDVDCILRPKHLHCLVAGDERASEQPTLTMMHTIMMREHNRRAKQLASINPHWTDEKLYHEARHLVAAELQHIIISEFLPVLIGKQLMKAYNLTAAPANSYSSINNDASTLAGSNIGPLVTHAFSTAAFRMGHTFIQGTVRFADAKTYEPQGSESLRNLFKRPFHFYAPNRVDQVLAGALDTPTQSFDAAVTREISGHLFEEPANNFVGLDLPAINILRAREQGTASYNSYRELCGMKRAKSFKELEPQVTRAAARAYAKLYASVDDIDLWSAGVAEHRIAGGQIGPTFACLIARQFRNLKLNDRFWYENEPKFASAFTLPQLTEIRKVKLSRLLCANSDMLTSVQINAIRMPHSVTNPRVTCNSLQDINIEHWREIHPQQK